MPFAQPAHMYRQKDVGLAAEYPESISAALCGTITYCSIAIIYEWQERYDKRCGRVNRIPKGHWQGLGEGFIIADFIDVLQFVSVWVCVREYVSESRDTGWGQWMSLFLRGTSD